MGAPALYRLCSIMESMRGYHPRSRRETMKAIAALARTWLAADGPRRAVSGAGDVLRRNAARRFPPPWTIEEHNNDASLIVCDHNKQALA